MLKHALSYVSDGFLVFPVGNDRKPLIKGGHGFKDATDDIEIITEWWKQWPHANIGIPTGGGIAVVDIDVKNSAIGLRNWQRIAGNNGGVPHDWIAKTGSGGYHCWYSTTAAIPSKSATFAQNIDTRGEGGYVVVPPSQNERGPYRWVSRRLPNPPPMPDWLVQLCQLKKTLPGQNFPSAGRKRAAYLDAHLIVPQGQRNETAASIAGLLLSTHSKLVAWEALRQWNNARCVPPLSNTELSMVFRSISKRHDKSYF
jgi:hypothetical protein